MSPAEIISTILACLLILLALAALVRPRIMTPGCHGNIQPCPNCGYKGEHVILITAQRGYGTRVRCTHDIARHGHPISIEQAAAARRSNSTIYRSHKQPRPR